MYSSLSVSIKYWKEITAIWLLVIASVAYQCCTRPGPDWRHYWFDGGGWQQDNWPED